jgi:methionyl aminopeptidase
LLIGGAAALASRRRAGATAAETLAEVGALARAGATTDDLDAAAEAGLERRGARSAARLVYGFPSAISISVNNEAAHAPAGRRVLAAGDLVNLDLAVESGGYYADCALALAIEPADAEARRLAASAAEVLFLALGSIRSGTKARALGALIEREAAARGYRVLVDLGGHGLGRAPHEAPDHLDCYDNPEASAVFEEGQVLAIELFLSTGDRSCAIGEDGWTLVTSPTNRVAQAERTILVTRSLPEILSPLASDPLPKVYKY